MARLKFIIIKIKDINMNIMDEIKPIIESLTPENAIVKPVSGSVFTYYVNWWREIEGQSKNFKPIAIQILDETIIDFDNLLIDEKSKRLEEIKNYLKSKFQEFTPNCSQSTDSEYPNPTWEI